MLKRVISILFCLTGVLIINCGSPMGPVDSTWRSVISLVDYSYRDLQCDPAGIVHIASENRILRFNGVDFETFAEFDGYHDVDIFTFDGGDLACLDCSTYDDYGTPPGLFRYKGGSWEQIELPDDIDDIIDFEVVDADLFWIYAYTKSPGYLLYRYYYGEWTNYDFTDYFVDTEVSSSGTFFAISDRFPFYVFISEDNGGVWTKEPIVFTERQLGLAQVGRPSQDCRETIVSYGDVLYMVAVIGVNGVPYYSLIKREGDPGEGYWVPLVICPQKAPDTHTFESVAFDGTGRGLVAGEETSIVSDGDGVWVKELFDHQLNFLRGSPTGGFWAICRDNLYYHP
jgi:hypothetical protein